MVKSYEIEFIGSENVASILMETLRTDNREFDLKRTENGFILRLYDLREKKGKERGEERKKRIIVDCTGSGEYRDGCVVIVNSKKLPNGKLKAINACLIARELSSMPEIPMLGALAKIGVIKLSSLMAAIYRKYGYNHAIAVKRGFESF